MTRALVIRTYGDPNIALPVADTLSNSIDKIDKEELRQLRAELGVSKYVRNKDYKEKLREAETMFHVEPVTGIRGKLLSLVGLFVLLKEGDW